MDRDWTASLSIRFRNGTCIIILDKKYNIENSSCHFGSYGSIWTGPSPLRSFGAYTIFFCDWPVHILPYDPQCHELFAIYLPSIYFSQNITMSPNPDVFRFRTWEHLKKYYQTKMQFKYTNKWWFNRKQQWTEHNYWIKHGLAGY